MQLFKVAWHCPPTWVEGGGETAGCKHHWPLKFSHTSFSLQLTSMGPLELMLWGADGESGAARVKRLLCARGCVTCTSSGLKRTK